MKRVITFLMILAFISPFSIISSQAAVKDCKPLNVPVLGYDNLLITVQSIAIKNPGNDRWIEVDYKIDNPTNQRIRKGNFTLYFASQGSHSDEVNWIIEPNSSLSRKAVLGYNDTEWPYILAYEEYDFSPQEGYESIVWQLPGRNCEYVSPSDGKSRAEAAAAADKAAADKAAADKAAADKAAADKAAADKAAADKAAADKAAADKAAADKKAAVDKVVADAKILKKTFENYVATITRYKSLVSNLFRTYPEFFEQNLDLRTSLQRALDYKIPEIVSSEEVERMNKLISDDSAPGLATDIDLASTGIAKFIEVEKSNISKAKKITIICTKGKITKKVTAVKPKCPTGYKVKK